MAGLHGGPVRVRVPATSANLGPGFDSFGLALARHDVVTAVLAGSELAVDVVGEGAEGVPRDGSHLVVASLLSGLKAWAGERPAGLRLRCVNRIPHSRGLGSSAAAIVSGLVAARALLADPAGVADLDVLNLANQLEGHPDNVAASLFGGLTLSWTDGDVASAVRLEPDPGVRPVVCIPSWSMSTERARGLLPVHVPHVDAVFNSSRAALLVAALTRRPDLLVAATHDRLHQPYRASAMRPTADLVAKLRDADIAAVVSGAGPTVLALTVSDGDAASAVRRIAGDGWDVETLDVDCSGAIAEYLAPDSRLHL